MGTPIISTVLLSILVTEPEGILQLNAAEKYCHNNWFIIGVTPSILTLFDVVQENAVVIHGIFQRPNCLWNFLYLSKWLQIICTSKRDAGTLKLSILEVKYDG